MNEIKYMFKSKIIIILILITCIILAIGVNSLNMTNDFKLFYLKRTSSTISFNSAKFGAEICSMLFALFTVLILDKDKRNKSKSIIESNLNYLSIVKIRIISIVFYAVLTTIMGMAMVMIVQKVKYGIPIDIYYYLFSYGLIFFLTILFSVLIISGLYLLTESLDMSIITFGLLFIKSLTSNNYLLNWIGTNMDVVSDFTGIGPVSKTIIYNRLLWFFISMSVFFIGLLFRRRYENKIWKSFLINIKNKGLLVLTIFSLLGSSFAYAKEPYTSEPANNIEVHSDENIYLKGIYPEVDFNTKGGEMNAHVLYDLINKGSETIKFYINEGLKINSLRVNGEKTEYKKVKNENIIEIPIPSEEKIKIEFFYEGKVKCDRDGVGRAMPGYISKDSIYLLEVSNWIFRPIVQKGDLIDISGYLSASKDLTVITPGKLVSVESKGDKNKWIFEYSSHTADIGAFAGKYKKTEINVENMTVEFYYAPKHEEYVKNMKIEEHIKNMMKYYIENIGEYYSKKYPLKIAEVSIYKRGGHSSENVITFSENSVNREESMYSVENEKEQINDFGRVSVYADDIQLIAHEMAHQWWGTGVNIIENSPWSSEGLANYSSYKYIQKEFGDMISSNVFLSPWKNRVAELKNYYYIKNKDMRDKLNPKFIKSLEMENKQTELYYLMPLELLKGEEIQGEKVFSEGIKRVYKKYLLKNLTYNEFLKEMNLTKEAIEVE